MTQSQREELESYLIGNSTRPIEVDLIPEATKHLRKRKGGGHGAGGSLSNAGGRTITSSGMPKVFGGYYGGAAGVPFTSGKPTPRGLLPLYLGVSGVYLSSAGEWLYSGIHAYW
ncbi:uncharacterized protein H6S33_006592 [Morchella sextelata]|uniref:uncharacterized protein n=1 Tax=Morchella sextelata TaxID=1174677 RepID=UPI001D03667D|nr:uncharacterized protein H6S33_006592 [Morchella sextelata]KAH0604924.1 hypothetical protein H6S33_006592 [Morchella sextelata]